jgi:hypothetical protein
MGALHTFTEPRTLFTRAELEAIVADQDARLDRIAERQRAGQHIGGTAEETARNIWALAIDALVEMDGEEPETVNPQAELADAMGETCASVWWPVQNIQNLASLVDGFGGAVKQFGRME